MMVDSLCLLPYCLFLCTPSPLCLKKFLFQVSLWNKLGPRYLQVIPMKSQHVPFQGMKGGMSGAGDVVNVCVFAFLCALNTVCVGGNVFMSHPLR